MNIKSLLLGSTLALGAVSGARAADAVVAPEPEPVEYVRVCEVYGAGFFYIPGTETCLRMSGYFRYDIGVGDLFGLQSFDRKKFFFDDPGVVDVNDTYYKRMRAQLRFDARSETELGTLRGYAALNFQWDANQESAGDLDGDGIDEPVVGTEDEFNIEEAYIELGGFRVGAVDSMFITFTDYAGAVINDDFLVPYGPLDGDLTHQISYTFEADNGIIASIALEEGNDDTGFETPDGSVVIDNAFTLDSYVPHVVAGVGYTGGWGSIKAVAAYDSVWEEFAAKVRLDVKPTEAFTAFIMGGYKSSEDVDGFNAEGNPVTFAGPNFYGNWGGDWAVWGGGSAEVTDKATINVQLAYDDYENFSAVANVEYELVPAFVVTPEIAYADNFDDDFGDDDDGEFGGFLRLQRNF
jgi:opacity protein-like surface antigen